MKRNYKKKEMWVEGEKEKINILMKWEEREERNFGGKMLCKDFTLV